MASHDELWALIGKIPRGRVCGYGDVGRNLRSPVSGLLVGRWMRSSPANVPWWRVVGKDGTLLIGRQSPHLADEQEERLALEGIKLEGGRVPTTAFCDLSELVDD